MMNCRFENDRTKNIDENKPFISTIQPLSALRSNYLADLTSEEINIIDFDEENVDSSGLEILIKPNNNSTNLKSDRFNSSLSDAESKIDYCKILNEFKSDLKNCLKSNLETENYSIEIDRSNISSNSFGSPNEKIETINNLRVTTSEAKYFSANLRNPSGNNLNRPIQSTPLPDRTKKVKSFVRKSKRPNDIDEDFFMDDNDDALDELIIEKNYNRNKYHKIDWHQYDDQVRIALKLPKISSRTKGFISLDQINYILNRKS